MKYQVCRLLDKAHSQFSCLIFSGDNDIQKTDQCLENTKARYLVICKKLDPKFSANFDKKKYEVHKADTFWRNNKTLISLSNEAKLNLTFVG